MRDNGLSAPLYRGRLCGTLADQAVILECGDAPAFEVGERLVVHSHLRGQAIGFVASVIAVADRPVPHFYLSFPEDFEVLELRKAMRVPALIPVRIELGDEARLVESGGSDEGVIINVSRSGCALSSPNAFGPNQSITLRVTLPGQPGEYRLSVTVVTRKDTDSLHVHGARFQSGRQVPESLHALQSWLAHQEAFWPAQEPVRPRKG